MSSPLTLADIADVRAYERERAEFRRAVIELKRLRRVGIGPIVTVVFENATTLRFQIQEMARAERMSADEQIQEELDAYNPLLPGDGELSMTLFIELTSADELRWRLPRLVGIETALYASVGEGDTAVRVPCAVDPEHSSQRTSDEVAASVHYVRIALGASLRERFTAEPVVIGIDHPEYRHESELTAATKASLCADWTP